MNTTVEKRASVYDQITERIISMLENGTVPWRKPWKVQTGSGRYKCPCLRLAQPLPHFGHTSLAPGTPWAMFKVPSKIRNNFWKEDDPQGVSE
jgi:hypothetical protein